MENFTVRDWQILLANAEAITLKKDEVLVPENDVNDSLYVVNSGRLKMNLKHGQQLSVGPGEMASKYSVLDHKSHDLVNSIVADDNSTISAINLSFLLYVSPHGVSLLIEYRRLFETEYELAARFYKYIANQLNSMLRILMSSYAGGPTTRDKYVELAASTVINVIKRHKSVAINPVVADMNVSV